VTRFPLLKAVDGLPQYSKLFERRLEMIKPRCLWHGRNKPQILQAKPGHLLKRNNN
jgi:hypothetical protein